jgi:RNA polymerase sigma-70 factor (ECF subfamily)
MTSNGASAEEAMKEIERRHDANLIDRMGGGDEGALAEFYHRHSPTLYGVAVKILNDPREAEDALQEGLIRMWRSAATYQPKLSSPFSWAVMIVRNKAIDRLRVLQRNNRVVDRVAFEAAFNSMADEKSAIEPDFRERRAMACSALSQLPRDQREPLELAFFRGLTHEEVAAHLETPLGTVKARIRRGLIQIRKSMSHHHE